VWAHGEEIGFGGAHGAMAQRVPIDGARVYDLPAGMDPALAATLGIAGLAGWLPLAWRAPVEPGETVLVLGATGTAGIVAVQAARLLGADRVVAAGRNAKRLERAAERGADATVQLGGTGDLAARFKEACGGGGSYVVDALWGEPLAAAVEVAARGARVVCVGRMAEPSLTIPSRPVIGRALTIMGHSTYEVPEDEFAALHQRLVGHALAGIRDAWRRKAEGAVRTVALVP
jgi:NADPH2:quinone reductase